MNILENEKLGNKYYKREWKEKNKEYLKQLQKFMDIIDNIDDEQLKLDIIYEMLKCDEVLTKIAEERYETKYKK